MIATGMQVTVNLPASIYHGRTGVVNSIRPCRCCVRVDFGNRDTIVEEIANLILPDTPNSGRGKEAVNV